MGNEWLTVNRAGLRKIVLRRGFGFVLYELIQNAWDTAASYVDIKVTPVPGKPLVEITVEDDDPDGFKNLEHAYTLYAESEKKGDPEKRGFMNLGEKLVLAICEHAEIASTRGCVIFDKDDGRTISRKRRDKGTVFKATIRMNREQMDEMMLAASKLLPPIPTRINGIPLVESSVERSFTVRLPTMIADEEGVMRPTRRLTTVRLMHRPDEPGCIYEMGIPVCETGDPWHIDVRQKVPLNADRDNVTPAYLRELRVAVVNALKEDIAPEVAASPAAIAALESPDIAPEAVRAIVAAKYGEGAMVASVTDKQANHVAQAAGRTVIPGSAFSAEQWNQIRAAGALPVTTTEFATKVEPGGEQVPESELTEGMKGLRRFAQELALAVLDRPIRVYFERDTRTGRRACYGGGTLTFNVSTLGEEWFECGLTEGIIDLIIHEFGHEYEGNHLSSNYYAALTRIGAKVVKLALKRPYYFQWG